MEVQADQLNLSNYNIFVLLTRSTDVADSVKQDSVYSMIGNREEKSR